ncbi:LuxR C-terminal-related transcriptional regulator [Streptomyces sp. NBC_01728]|uniref:ATP-binding protein n=1 Tax=unclassified Streptomyces TaxID=2593676 RepID=UPI00225BF8D4|nr:MULTISPECIES: LuxR C-terminal-related transcriptional regulator [unclassified Streptomyces]MCX4460725.1 LuxR C-terminal-related transcriptional regulator [Streptomyces sp. NBC_01719]MCX4499945.1 LuxR C-terminal-related transcriptional regulator [Streptomyces sp. NBC_01728]
MARPTSATPQCTVCSNMISARPVADSGQRSAQYCSNACRQRAYRRRLKSNWTDEAGSSGLFTQLSSFIGRTGELVEVGRLLRHTRLMTLRGPAGVGKTRLAVELAKQEERSHRCVIRMIDLVSAKPATLQEQFTSAFPWSEHSKDLTGQEYLLVLDNCEGVLDVCGPIINSLLLHHSQLRILATSREALRLPGEVVHSVTGLAPPASDRDNRLSDYFRSDAVHLFVDRARAVTPDFQLTEENAPIVGAICKDLDGLPLAIELAARLVQTFLLTEIHDNLHEYLSVLPNGWRTAHPRHQGWHSALTSSYELLSPDERTLFHQISVLPGGISPQAAAAVASDTTTSLPALLQLLMGLEAKSLLIPAGKVGSTRLHMPAPIRHYAHQRLLEEGKPNQIYEGLVDWLTSLAAPLRESSATRQTVLHKLTVERANVEHALTWLCTGDDERQLLLAGALFLLDLFERQPRRSTRDLLASALDNAAPDSIYRDLAIRGAVVLAAWYGDHDEAVRLAQQCSSLSAPGQPEPLLTRLLSRLKTATPDNAVATADWLTDITWHELSWEELALAAKLTDRLLSSLRTEASSEHLRAALRVAGVVAFLRGDGTASGAHFTELLPISTDTADEDFAHAVAGLGLIAAGTGEHERALSLLAMAQEVDSAVLDHPWWRDRAKAARETATRALPNDRVVTATNAGRTLRRAAVTAYALRRQQAWRTEVTADKVLSNQESRITALLAEGLTNRQIAAHMHVSVRTIETHVRNIRTTLGLRSRAHIAAWSAQRQSAAS